MGEPEEVGEEAARRGQGAGREGKCAKSGSAKEVEMDAKRPKRGERRR